MKTERIDVLLVKNEIVESRNIAQRLIMAGKVTANGLLVHKPSEKFSPRIDIRIKESPKFVSRGGLKLEKALMEFGITTLAGKVCMDIGASTGGFTDCLIQWGAQKVYAIDVGYGQIHSKIRSHPKVVVMEKTNIKSVESLPESLDFVTIDVSFISITRVFLQISNWQSEKNLQIIGLIKPQFEAGRKLAAKGRGVIRSESDRKRIVADVQSYAISKGFEIRGVTESPIEGPKGNKEYLLYLYQSKNIDGNFRLY